MLKQDIHASHDVVIDWAVPDPHNPGFQCRACGMVTCGICPPGKGTDDDELALPCPAAPAPAGPRRIPLIVVRDRLPGETVIQPGGGSVQLGNGNTFQIAPGSITITINASEFALTAAQVQAATARLGELTAYSRLAASQLDPAFRTGVSWPLEPDGEDRP